MSDNTEMTTKLAECITSLATGAITPNEARATAAAARQIEESKRQMTGAAAGR